MAVHEINSEEWTGGEVDAPAPTKSRFEKWADHHPAKALCGGIVVLSLVHAADVHGQSWAQFWWRAFQEAVAHTISWGAFFGGFALMYWLLLHTALVNHLTGVQKSYLVLLAYAAFFVAAIFGTWIASGVLHMLARFA